MKKLNGQISIFVNKDSTTIELSDKDSGTMFCRVELTAEQFCSAISRLANGQVSKMEIRGYDIRVPTNRFSKI